MPSAPTARRRTNPPPPAVRIPTNRSEIRLFWIRRMMRTPAGEQARKDRLDTDPERVDAARGCGGRTRGVRSGRRSGARAGILWRVSMRGADRTIVRLPRYDPAGSRRQRSLGKRSFEVTARLAGIRCNGEGAIEAAEPARGRGSRETRIPVAAHGVPAGVQRAREGLLLSADSAKHPDETGSRIASGRRGCVFSACRS